MRRTGGRDFTPSVTHWRPCLSQKNTWNPKTAQSIPRHAKPDITLDIYTHAQEAAKRAALERFESRLVQ